ncbi:hypothetical protein M3Y97_00889600 [Aphelenchoides bicaudatus]|nr:hypothetical protein M3Y97_00889600 [Aphelenchoides bicaudatus]
MIRLVSNVILIISLLITLNNASTDSEFISNSTLTPPSIRYIFATLRTIVRQTRSLDVGEPVTKWQLFNECSQGFVQSFLRTVNALGKRQDVCLSEFKTPL